MKDPRSIVRLPLITEKGTAQRAASHAYTFLVDRSANKIEIANAVEAIFKVDVKKVRTINYLGKAKRLGRFVGKRSDWKKAMVTIGADQKIEVFEDL